jgi:Tol biopolymer transport system component
MRVYAVSGEGGRGGFLRSAMILLLSLLMAAAFIYMGVESASSSPNDVLLVSSNASGTQGNADSYALAISPDGRYVAFTSPSSNLVTGVSGYQQAFRKDLLTSEVKLASCDSSGNQGTNGTFHPSISADGRYVAFSSSAPNLLSTPTTFSQVFRKDLQTNQVALCSSTSGGTQGNSNSNRTSMSSDGRYVTFESDATNLGPATTPGRTNIFRKDLQTGEVRLASSNASGTEGDQSSMNPKASTDGRYVTFNSDATNLVTGGTSGTQIFRKDLQTGEVKLCSASSTDAQGNGTSDEASMSSDGRYAVFNSDSSNLVPGVDGFQVYRKDLLTGETVLCSKNASGAQGDDYSGGAAVSPDGRFVCFSSSATNLVTTASTIVQVYRKDLVTGTVVLVSCDASGAQGDDNSFRPSIASDGRYVAFASHAGNLVSGGTSGQQIFRKELQMPSSFYFAEGYTGEGFQEYLCLGNPNDEGTFAVITYMFPDGSTQEQQVGLEAKSRATVNVNAVVGADKQVSARVDCDLAIVAERPMYFEYQGQWTGGHDVVGASSPADTWYFAEGYTGSGFDEWICVLNPGDATANLTFRFQTQEEGEKAVTGFSVPAHSRQSFKANDLLEGGSYQTSLALESTQPVVAERPMYFNYQGTGGWGWTGGHCVMGASELATDYYFAEGTTRGGFEEWLTIQNPGLAEINVHATYFLGSGTPIEMDHPVPPARRSTIYVPLQVGTDQDVSVRLTSTQHFLAERPMYFNYQGMGAWGWTGGHCVIGATESSTDWFFAEGYTGSGFEEWLCIQNPGANDATLNVTYYPEGGAAPITREHKVAANSRYTIPVNVDAGADLAISAGISSDQPIICERPMYFNYNGVWNGGHDVLGYMP